MYSWPPLESLTYRWGRLRSGLFPRAGSHAGPASVGHQWQSEEPIPWVRHATLPCYPKVVGRPPVPLTPVCSSRGLHLFRRRSTAPVGVVVDVRLHH